MTQSLLQRAGGIAVAAAIVGMIVVAQFWAFMPPKNALATTPTPSSTFTPTLTPIPPTTFTVSGFVCDLFPPDCGEGLRAVTVRLVPGRQTETDRNARFNFFNVPNGNYTIEIGTPGTFSQYRPRPIVVDGADVDVTIHPTPYSPPVGCGDATGDGHVNSLDAALTLQFVVRLKEHLPYEDATDADGNGLISPVDAALMLQMDAGLVQLGLPPCAGAVLTSVRSTD